MRNKAGKILLADIERNQFFAGELRGAALLGIKVVKAGLAAKNLARFGKFKALRIRFVGFYCHIF